MELLNKLCRYTLDADYRFVVNALRGIYNYMPDKKYLEKMFKAKTGHILNLDDPRTFNEKLQWLKINDRKPEYTVMVDKYCVREYISEKIGKEYLIPLLGVWNDPDEIDFDKLPNQFVLKCTHDSGGVIVCRNKLNLNINDVKEKIKASLKRNYYYKYREWPYKNVSPRIIAETYLKSSDTTSFNTEAVPNDYKLQCFDGKFDHIFVAEGRFSGRGVRYHYFDRQWNYIPYCPYKDTNIADLQRLKPKCFEEMIKISETLSQNLPELRVDLYEISGKVYFGEITFYSEAGFDIEITEEADLILGEKLKLPKICV